jgi:hypothetical protein
MRILRERVIYAIFTFIFAYFLCLGNMSTPPRKSMFKVKVAVAWCIKQQNVHPSYHTFDIYWLREISLRQLLAHVVNKVNARVYLLDNAESINV